MPRWSSPVAETATRRVRMQVRATLAHLHDLPYLQSHPLAAHVRTASNGSVQRAARRLQADLTEAIHALAPAPGGGAGRASTRAVRRHRVMALRYLDGLPVVEVQRRLAISRTEVFRAHREGLAAVAQFVHERWAGPQRGAAPAPTSGHDHRAALPALPARMVARLPRLPGQLTSFIGRERQLAELQRLVAGTGPASPPRARLITLVGAPGAGKTRLALQLDREPRACVCRPGGLHPPGGGGRPRLRAPHDRPPLGDRRRCRTAAPGARGGGARPRANPPPPRQLRARRRGPRVRRGPPGRVPGAHRRRHQPRGAPPVRRTAVPRPSLGAAARGLAQRRAAAPTGVPDDAAPASTKPWRCSSERARAVVPEFAGNAQDAQTRGRDLPAAGRAAAGDRAGGGADQAALAAGAAGAAGAAAAPADRRRARPARAPADAARRDRLELRPARRRRAALFRRLAVFVGGWTLEAAQAVAGDAGAERRRWGRTAGRACSMACRRCWTRAWSSGGESTLAEPRFTMLETIREFALERLERSYDAAAVRRRHARYVVELLELAAPELRGPRKSHALDLMEREHGNARAALDWCQRHPQPDGVAWALRLCAAVARYWWIRGYLTEGMERIRHVLGLVRAAPLEPSPQVVEAHAMTLFGAGVLAKYQGDFAAARAFRRKRSPRGRRPATPTASATPCSRWAPCCTRWAPWPKRSPSSKRHSPRCAKPATRRAWPGRPFTSEGALLGLGEPRRPGRCLTRVLLRHVGWASTWRRRGGCVPCAPCLRARKGTPRRPSCCGRGWPSSSAPAHAGDGEQEPAVRRRRSPPPKEPMRSGRPGRQRAGRSVAPSVRRSRPSIRARRKSWLVRAQAVALGDQLRVVWKPGCRPARAERRPAVRRPISGWPMASA